MINYIWTLSGHRVDIHNPKPSDFDIETIAVALGRICRFGGKIKKEIPFYSVAEHSVLVSKLCPKHLKLHGLLHDGSESFLNDIISPLKLIPEVYNAYNPIEERFMRAIAKQFKFSYSQKNKREVKKYDRIMAHTEISHIVNLLPDEIYHFPLILPASTIQGLLPADATKLFLKEYKRIINEKI
jgi:hypothetical protein